MCGMCAGSLKMLAEDTDTAMSGHGLRMNMIDDDSSLEIKGERLPYTCA
jgi:hypothetical protein